MATEDTQTAIPGHVRANAPIAAPPPKKRGRTKKEILIDG